MHRKPRELSDTMKNQARFPTMLSASPAACLIASSLLVAGCGTTSRDAVKSGGVIASNTSASYIAALGGGVIGRQAGLSIGKADRQRALEAEYRALEAARGGQPVVWQGAGISGSVVAAAPFQVGSQNCRQYSHTVTVKGQDSVARGAACRNADGTWTPLG
jgi:surface antigen